MKKWVILAISLTLILGCVRVEFQPPPDPKPSAAEDALTLWRDADARRTIMAFVAEVTTPGSGRFVPQSQRRAFFDMDGTVLCEKPEYIEVVMAQHRLREKAAADPSLAGQPLYKAVLEDDAAYLYKHVKELILEAFAGETLAAYQQYSRRFLSETRHPRFHKPLGKLFYAPMVELIGYLQARGFTVYIVSTSQQEFIRSVAADALGVSPEQIIGTMVGFSLANLDADAPPAFTRTKTYFSPYNADADKVVRIRERGLLPAVMAFGNSMGDYAMLDAAADSPLPSLAVILDHDDPEREYDYHKEKLLAAASQRNWLVVSMKRDFQTIFPE